MSDTILTGSGTAKSFVVYSASDISWFTTQDWGDTLELLVPRLFSQETKEDGMRPYRITIQEMVEEPENLDLSFVPTGEAA